VTFLHTTVAARRAMRRSASDGSGSTLLPRRPAVEPPGQSRYDGARIRRLAILLEIHDMKRSLQVLLCLSVAFVPGCGEDDTAPMKQMGADLKDAGSKLGAELAQAGAKLDAFAQDVASGVAMKGDELATSMKAKLPDLEAMVDGIQAKGAAAGENLSVKLDKLESDVEALAQAGAGAAAELKQKVLDAFADLAAAIKAAFAKLGA